MAVEKVSLIDGVMKLSEEIMENAKHVTIHEHRITEVAGNLKKAIDEQKEYWMGYPQWFEPEVRRKQEIDYMLLSYELMAGAINYQYWYGTSEIRPNGACATMMYELLNDSFELAGSIHTIKHRVVCEDAVRIFIRSIARHRFPNVEKRIYHLQEIAKSMANGPNTISYMVKGIHNGSLSLEDFIDKVITTYPGYSGDMFLKRPFLLAMMLYRRVQWFKDEIHKLPVPADYQIPKMLRWLGCIEYSKELSDMINNHIIIPAGSMIEAEIRAASEVACKLLSLSAGVSMCDVDTYLWLNRKKCSDPFHLTVTTDY